MPIKPGDKIPSLTLKLATADGPKDVTTDELFGKGVDSIVCLSVNDAFVMGAWGKDQKVGDKVKMVADGGADFTRAVGLDFDASRFGMGVRSQRYAAIVERGVLKQLFVEEPMKFEVSSADAVLKHL
ncbi:MAG TPA: peroxiredoxin [Deltaproteobacteria bacterium]|nr:peroxiredoxin [Deltaproteobacteria bacterium]